MPCRRLHEAYTPVGDLFFERSFKARRVHRIWLYGYDEARAALQRDSCKGAQVGADVHYHVAVAHSDRSLLVDIPDGLLQGEKVELASILFGSPELAQWRLP